MTTLRLLAACIAALVLAMTLLAGGHAAVDEEVTGNESQIDAPQEEVVGFGAEIYAMLSPFLGVIVAIAILVVVSSNIT